MNLFLTSIIFSLFSVIESEKPIEKDISIEWSASNFSKKAGLLYYIGQPFSGTLEKCYPDGKLKSTQAFREGKAHGWQRIWNENGQCLTERYYQLNLQEGAARGWWEDGSLRFSYHYQHDLQEGNCKEWLPNGQLYTDFNYKNGYEDGWQRMWWDDGTIRANYVMKNGRRFGLQGRKPCYNVHQVTK